MQELSLINNIDNELLTLIGADVPACYYGQNCIATNIGNTINKDINFPKYYFVLVYPYIHLSTATMYSKIDEYLLFNKDQNNKVSHSINLNKKDKGNDFEKIIRKENKEILNLLDFLSSIENSIFTRMTGSGSCCYVAFENKHIAKKAFDIIEEKYDDYWIYLAENNIINE